MKRNGNLTICPCCSATFKQEKDSRSKFDSAGEATGSVVMRPAYLRYTAMRVSRWLLCGAILFAIVLLTPTVAGDFLGFSMATLERIQNFEIYASYLLLAVILCELVMLAIYLPSLSYQLTGRELLIAKGIMQRTTTSIALQRIAHVCVRRDANQMLFGLSSIDIHTAGNTNQRILSIDWLSKEEAKELQLCLSHLSGKGAEPASQEDFGQETLQRLKNYGSQERRAA